MPRHRAPSRSHIGLRSLLALVLLVLSASVVTAAPAQAVASIQLSKSAPAEVLVGKAIPFTLTATNPTSNPDAVEEYNVSFRDVLPLGVTYSAGSTSPSRYGEPTIYTAGDGRQTLVWSNVADLAPGSTVELSFSGTVNAAVAPVGASVSNQAFVYANTDPRTLPRFSSTGAPTTGFTQSASATSSTNITALTVDKSEPSPGGELMRGVHDHPTVYTLTVTNNDVAATNGVVTTDFIPAGLEFLGCGGVDNSAGEEYPGSGSLTGTPDLTADCPTAATVETVTNPAGYPAGVYTKVVWNLGNMAPSAVRVIKYAAGIPQRANTATFPNGTPTAASRLQTANLDNNTGASTRETGTEQALTNHVMAQGTYSGAVTVGTSTTVTARDTLTVRAEDLRLLKSVSPGGFTHGAVATYTLTIDTSEYTDADDIIVRDKLPNGICPLDDNVNYTTGAPSDCAADPVYGQTGREFQSVTQNADGTFDIVFATIPTMTDNETFTITYKARMRTTYTGTQAGINPGDPTSAGDGFVNTAALTGDTTDLPNVNAPAPTGELAVADDASASLTSSGPDLDKTILPRSTPMTCPTSGAGLDGYTNTPTAAQVTFHEGDRVCFKIRVDFPANVSTRNPIMTDFLPPAVTYEPGSAVLTSRNTATSSFSDASGNPVWTLGDVRDSGRFAKPGDIFEAVVAGTVATPATGPAPDITANLAKFRYTSGLGSVVALRDQIDLYVAAVPPVRIYKGVRDVNDAPAAGNAANVDGSTVRQGDVVTYRLDIFNNGSATTRNNIDVFALDIWDVLPVGVTCSMVSAISHGGVCTNPGDGSHPTFTTRTTQSAIRWDLPATERLAPGTSRTLTYDVTLPSVISVSTTFLNRAYVESFRTDTDQATTAEHYPTSNVNTTIPVSEQDTVVPSDPSSVVTPHATVAKTNTTTITESGNTVGQAVIGEVVDYTVSLRIPARTTVYNGRLIDPLPSGISFVAGSASAAFSASNTAPAADALPVGVTLDGTNATLTFPTTYTNNDATDHLFQVRLQGRVTTDAGNTHGTTRTNTAAFTSTTSTAPESSVIGPRNGQSSVTVVDPFPTLAKTNNAGATVVAGQTIRYTLSATNLTGRPPLHDSWVVDCVPEKLVFSAFVTPVTGTATTEPGTGSNGCAAGTTRIAWNVPSINGGTTATLAYDITVASDVPGSATYTNTATLTGSSLSDGKADPFAADNALERAPYTQVAARTVTIAPAGIAKSADPSARTIGERGTWTLNVSIPANVNFYDAAVIDQLPVGVKVDTLTLDSSSCSPSCTIPSGPTALANTAGAPAGTNVGWSLGDITRSTDLRTITLVYSAVVEDLPSVDRGDVLTNSATLKWRLTNGTDPTSTGASFDRTTSTATANVTVREPLLGLAKRVDDATVAPDQTFTYTVDVTNSTAANTSAAYNVTVTDAVPTGVVVDAASITGGGVLSGATANGGGTIEWTLAGPLAVGATQSYTYTAKLAASSTLGSGALTNTADITRYESLATGGRVYDGPTAQASVTPIFPFVTIAKSTANTPSYIGSPTTWTLTATNTSQTRAYGVDMVDTLPANWAYDADSARVSVAGGAVTLVEPTLSTAGGRQVLTWTDLGNIDPTQTVVVTFTATPAAGVVGDAGVGASVAHTNSVAVTAADATGATSSGAGAYNGSPATAVARIHSADLGVTKTHTGSPVAGQDFIWTVTVRNDGPDTAVGPFTVTDTVPAGVGTFSASGTGWSCSNGVSDITCTRTNAADTLAASTAFPVITVTTAIPASTVSGTEFLNRVSVDGRTYDAQPNNDTASDTASSVRSVDLAIDKALSGAMVAGDNATYTLDVRNNGPSDSAGPIVVTDDVPAGTTFVSASGTGWDCDELDGTVTCSRTAALAANTAADQITFVVKVNSGRRTTVSNTATVDGPHPDPVASNDSDTVETTPAQSADLTIQKSSQNDFVPGETGTYRFRVDNLGSSDARAVRITDTLPAELTYGTFRSIDGVWSCSNVGQDVTCTLTGDLVAGTHATVEIDVDIDPSHTGDTVNSATVASDTPDPHSGNNTDSDDTGNTVIADLDIAKSHTGDFVAGEEGTYTLTVGNNGPSDAAGPIQISDTLPAGMTFVSADGTGWSCTGDGQTLECTRAGGIAVDTDAPSITVVVDVASSAGPGRLTNTASVTSDNREPETDEAIANNTATDPTDVVDRVDIAIDKVVSGSATVDAGSNATFALAVTNNGPSDADDVVVVDTLPAGMTLVSVDGDGWSCDSDGGISCTRASLAAGVTAPDIVVVAKVGSGVLEEDSPLTNSATVSTTSPEDDADKANNTDDAAVTVTTSADLALVKSHEAELAIAGETVAFDLAVTNNGPSDALAPIEIVDTLPVGLTYVSSGGAWTCVADEPTPDGQVVTCVLDGTDPLVAGTDAPLLQVTAQVDAAVDPGDYVNTATVGSATADPNLDNNTDTDAVTVQAEADLSIVKSHTDAARVADELAFTLQVRNDGPSEARGVVVTDELPASLEYVSATGTGWTCDAVDNAVTCALDEPLAPEVDAEPITVTVIVRPAAYPSVDNTAVVASNTPEADDTDNSSTDTVEVPAQVDLAITKSHTPDGDGIVQVGEELTYDLVVVNNGPTPDPGPVTVTDILPAGLTFVSAAGDGWDCVEDAGVVTCTDADGLAVDETSSIALTVTVEPSAYPSVVNVAAVTTEAEDTDPTNNEATDPTDVEARVELVLEKTLSSVEGRIATYELEVTNNGPNATYQDIVIVDTLPAELSFVEHRGDAWTCTEAGQNVTCTTDEVLEAGDSLSVFIVTRLADDAEGLVTNNAQVLGGGALAGTDDDAATLDAPEVLGAGGTRDGLPDTGGVPVALLVLGLVSLMGGAALILVARRKGTATAPPATPAG